MVLKNIPGRCVGSFDEHLLNYVASLQAVHRIREYIMDKLNDIPTTSCANIHGTLSSRTR